MERPIVTEIVGPKAVIEHDPFIDDLLPAVVALRGLASVYDLNANVINLEEYKADRAA